MAEYSFTKRYMRSLSVDEEQTRDLNDPEAVWSESKATEQLDAKVKEWVDGNDVVVLSADMRMIVLDEKKADPGTTGFSNMLVRTIRMFCTMTWMPSEAFVREKLWLAGAARSVQVPLRQQAPATPPPSQENARPVPPEPLPGVITVPAALPFRRGGTRQVMAMAGVFHVVPGAKMHAEDTEPAPLPLLSPVFDAALYQDLFVIGGTNGRQGQGQGQAGPEAAAGQAGPEIGQSG